MGRILAASWGRIFAASVPLSLKHDACDESHDHERGDCPEKEIESAEQREEEADVGLAHVLRLSAAFRNHCVTA